MCPSILFIKYDFWAILSNFIFAKSFEFLRFIPKEYKRDFADADQNNSPYPISTPNCGCSKPTRHSRFSFLAIWLKVQRPTRVMCHAHRPRENLENRRACFELQCWILFNSNHFELILGISVAIVWIFKLTELDLSEWKEKLQDWEIFLTVCKLTLHQCTGQFLLPFADFPLYALPSARTPRCAA